MFFYSQLIYIFIYLFMLFIWKRLVEIEFELKIVNISRKFRPMTSPDNVNSKRGILKRHYYVLGAVFKYFNHG